jgi:hypothetical protein
MQRSFSLLSRPAARLLARPTALPAISQRLPMRFFSAAPEPLTVADIEGRVLKVLQDFAKVDSSKVPNILLIYWQETNARMAIKALP